ncbi:MAG: hypothetical protein HYY62_09620 [Deltaproteobacteria bacterium]|nr:hypothetical protein [Deltaproteobacteria bacterium]
MKIPFKLKLGVVILFMMALIVPMKSFADADDEGRRREDAYVINEALKDLEADIAEAYSNEWINGNAYNYHAALRNKDESPEDLKYWREAAFSDAQDFYTRAQEIKRLASAFNTKYYRDAMAASDYSDIKLKNKLEGAGYIENGSMLTLGFGGSGNILLDWTLTKFSQRPSVTRPERDHGSHRSGKYSKRGRDRDEDDDDDDSDSSSRKKRKKSDDDEDCDKRSGVETFFDNLMPWVGIVGGGFAAHSNYKLKKDMLRTGERLMGNAVAQGNSPYMYMPMMQAAMHYDPFGSVFESTLTPSLMAMTELHNRSRGKSGKASGSEFAKYYANKFRYQRMMEMAAQARAQGNTSSSSNSNFNYTFQRAIEGLKGLDRAFIPMDQMLDQMERRLGGAMQEMNGGMSSRQRQELLNVVSNLSNGIKSQEMFNKNMSMIFDQMRMLVGQAKESARSQDALINGQGGITTTVSGSNSDVFNSQWNRVGNPGVPWMNGQPTYGGGQAGGQFTYRGPGGQMFVGVGR